MSKKIAPLYSPEYILPKNLCTWRCVDPPGLNPYWYSPIHLQRSVSFTLSQRSSQAFLNAEIIHMGLISFFSTMDLPVLERSIILPPSSSPSRSLLPCTHYNILGHKWVFCHATKVTLLPNNSSGKPSQPRALPLDSLESPNLSYAYLYPLLNEGMRYPPLSGIFFKYLRWNLISVHSADG